jgi:diaminohydroxyphosphoribosylaminopyrimidine deaminase/5-amino-6-(5-phosphoribosylamino)uracil reductase
MPSNARDHKRPAGRRIAARAAAEAWARVLVLRRRARAEVLEFPVGLELGDARLAIARGGSWQIEPEPPPEVAELLALYLPLALVPHRRSFVLAHLAQSLDGRIATSDGDSQWLTGEADLCHTHRLRALADAVIVGANTVRQDDPRLTVRHCSGDQPVRVVLDPNLALAADRHVFRDGAAETLVLASADRVGTATRLGHAEIVPLPREGEHLAPQAIRAALARRGLFWLFVEGGGVTVSRFLAAGALDRLQIALAPVILGSGRPSLQLPEISALSGALRPRVRHFSLGGDVLVECILHE